MKSQVMVLVIDDDNDDDDLDQDKKAEDFPDDDEDRPASRRNKNRKQRRYVTVSFTVYVQKYVDRIFTFCCLHPLTLWLTPSATIVVFNA